MTKNDFTIKDSMVVKGVAILAMMWHHCFLEGRFEDRPVSCWPLGASRVTDIALFCRVCISLFAFVSGYGLYLSLKKLDNKDDGLSGKGIGKWYRQRYVSTFAGFWLIVVLAWIICTAINRLPVETYFAGTGRRDIVTGIFYMILELAGLSNFVGSPSLLGTWWYMGTALALIIFAPLLYRMLTQFGDLPTLAMLFFIPRISIGYPGSQNFFTFMPVFVIGMIFAERGLFTKITECVSKKNTKENGSDTAGGIDPLKYALAVVIMSVITLCCYYLVKELDTDLFWDFKWGLFPAFYIILMYLTVNKIPGINHVLAFLGKHSANIYMIHTFIRVKYMSSFIYSGNMFFVIFKLIGLSLIASLLVEGLKKLINFKAITAKLRG